MKANSNFVTGYKFGSSFILELKLKYNIFFIEYNLFVDFSY